MIIEIEGNSSAYGRNEYRSIYYIEMYKITMVEKRILGVVSGINRYAYSIHVGSNTINGIDEKDAERILTLMRSIERDNQINSILDEK
jgi:hypothetical protein